MAYLDAVRFIEHHREECLCGARVLDHLVGEEELLRPAWPAKSAINRAYRRGIRVAGGVFEEEDDAKDRCEGTELGGVEGEDLFELDALDAEIFDEGCEDALKNTSVSYLRIPVEATP